MGNAVSHTVALCEEEQKQEQKQEDQPEQQKDADVPKESGPPPDKEEGTGSPAGEKPEQKSPPKSPERKNVGDDDEAAAKETEAAKKQAAGAQASSKAGQAEPTSVRKFSHEEAENRKAAHEASGGNKSQASEQPDPEDEEAVQVKTVPYDPRFPATNQARNCYTRYNEFYKCVAEKGEDAPECKFYQRAYRSLCPSEWVEGWNTAREEGNWFGKY
jgi:cytochrome c oxidase subunit 6b